MRRRLRRGPEGPPRPVPHLSARGSHPVTLPRVARVDSGWMFSMEFAPPRAMGIMRSASKEDADRLNKAGTDVWAWLTTIDHAPKPEARKAAERAGYKSGLLALASHIAHGWIEAIGDESTSRRRAAGQTHGTSRTTGNTRLGSPESAETDFKCHERWPIHHLSLLWRLASPNATCGWCLPCVRFVGPR